MIGSMQSLVHSIGHWIGHDCLVLLEAHLMSTNEHALCEAEEEKSQDALIFPGTGNQFVTVDR